ncbi:MAG: hypothetical protein ABIH42_00030, partial [Planctomycetota bacterium]
SKRLSIPVYQLEEEGYCVKSAGISAFDGGKASANAIEAIREEGYDLTTHQSRSLKREMLEEADLVIALGQEHLDYIKNWLPHLALKVMLIKPGSIKDPIGQPLEVYKETVGLISNLTDSILDIALGGTQP